MAKPKLEKEWKLWVTIGVILVAIVAYLYIVSRPPKEAGEYLWHVVSVEDDRSLQLVGSGKKIRFELIGLNIPESQAPKVREFLDSTLKDKWVRIKSVKVDPSGVHRGFVFLDGEDTHARLVRQGLAEMQRDAEGFDTRPYIELEMEAKRAQRGMWSESSAGAR